MINIYKNDDYIRIIEEQTKNYCLFITIFTSFYVVLCKNDKVRILARRQRTRTHRVAYACCIHSRSPSGQPFLIQL